MYFMDKFQKQKQNAETLFKNKETHFLWACGRGGLSLCSLRMNKTCSGLSRPYKPNLANHPVDDQTFVFFCILHLRRVPMVWAYGGCAGIVPPNVSQRRDGEAEKER